MIDSTYISYVPLSPGNPTLHGNCLAVGVLPVRVCVCQVLLMGSYIVMLSSDWLWVPVPELPELRSSPEGPKFGAEARKVFVIPQGAVSLAQTLDVILKEAIPGT